MRLDGKSAIVTGGGSGFGEGIAKRFAAEGAKVVVADIKAEAAERVAATIASDGGTAVACTADVSRRDQVQRMVDLAVERFGGLDAVVNNAGISHVNRPMLEVEEEEYDRIFAVNVKAIFHAAHAAVPVLRRQGRGGVILNIASTAGLRPRPGLTWYNASKGAVITMSKSMAVELAPDGIRVNAICPVAGDTPLLTTFLGGDTEAHRQRFLATVPLGRFSTAEDVANSCLFLASDEGGFLTGLAHEVDGGRCV
jgi:3-oxoacyl-[acyl-carrier protein] reductase